MPSFQKMLVIRFSKSSCIVKNNDESFFGSELLHSVHLKFEEYVSFYLVKNYHDQALRFSHFRCHCLPYHIGKYIIGLYTCISHYINYTCLSFSHLPLWSKHILLIFPYLFMIGVRNKLKNNPYTILSILSLPNTLFLFLSD